LEVDVSTDILIGVHGAGMTQLLFLPKHAAIIEVLHPSKFSPSPPLRYDAFAALV
jgi:hypothetical protein